MTWTDMSSLTRRAAAAPASVAALTAPTSPRTITVTYPAPMYSLPTRTTFAAFTIASAASIDPIRPRVSTIPNASTAQTLTYCCTCHNCGTFGAARMYKIARLSLYVVVVSCLALFAGCGGSEDSEPAVATPSLSLSKDRVPIGSAVTLTYTFVVAPNATFDKDYWVFVHVLDPDGEQMWTDDHQPPTATRQRKAGDTIEYKRTGFAPNDQSIG